MKISELFGITKSQHELDFVDVDIDSDSRGRLHHAAQSVWTHNVRPARKTGCRGWGCKQSRPLPRAVRAAKLCPRCSPSPGRELQIRRKRKP